MRYDVHLRIHKEEIKLVTVGSARCYLRSKGEGERKRNGASERAVYIRVRCLYCRAGTVQATCQALFICFVGIAGLMILTNDILSKAEMSHTSVAINHEAILDFNRSAVSVYFC